MIEEVILGNLLHNQEYVQRVLPFLKGEYFESTSHALIFNKITEFVSKYHKPPTQEELLVEIRDTKGLHQKDFESAVDFTQELVKKNKAPSIDWLIEHTEKFCKDQALYNAIAEAAQMIDDENADVGNLPELLKNALSVSFDTNIGHDYTSMIEARYKLLRQTNAYRLAFDIEMLNAITNGGLPKKTLSVVAASTGAGKSLFLCHVAAKALQSNKNVLYITLEMAEERISERIDANLIGIDIQDLPGISLQDYTRRLEKALKDCTGRLIVKEYPTAGAGVAQFRALLNELRLKKDFVADLICIDYVNICSSSRFKAAAVNSYTYVKAICEEIRGLSIEFDVPILSATQLNREGTDNSDSGLKEISDSHGLAMTVDLLLAMIRSEELDEQNLVMFKQLKNRFSDMSAKLRFVVGIDRSKMRLFNAETEVKMSKSRPLSNGSPRGEPEEVDQDTGEIKSFGKPKVDSSRFRGIKV